MLLWPTCGWRNSDLGLNIEVDETAGATLLDSSGSEFAALGLDDEAAAAGWSVDPGLGEGTVIINVWRCVIINRLNLVEF